MKALTPDQVRKLLPAACRATLLSPKLTLRAGGAEVSSSKRDELLAKCAAGEYVELDVDVLAYEQQTGVANRNFVRFRDGAMVRVGASGRGMPFLRDHEQGDVTARAGTILSSKTDKRGEGDYAIFMTVRLTAPWAVELALRGLLSTVSIGWHATGPVECSVCKAEIGTKCYHWPGARVTESTDDDGNKRYVRDRKGALVVEWVFTEAELVECSAVSVPAVPGAHIEEIRAALAAIDPGFGADPAQEEDEMKILAALAAMLSLAPTAGEDEAIEAVKKLKGSRDTAEAKLAIAEGERAKLAGEIDVYRQAERKTAQDAFIRDAVASGRITLGDESAWRKLYELNADDAKGEMAKRAAGCATPLGLGRQTPTAGDPPKDPPSDKEPARAAVEAAGINYDRSVEIAKRFGAKDPHKAIANAVGTEG